MITAHLSGESLVIDDLRVTGPGLIDMVLLGRKVPVLSSGQDVGTAWISDKLLHVRSVSQHLIMPRKYLMGILDGGIISARVQEVPV